MPLTEALASVAEAKAYLQITGSSLDATLEGLIDKVTGKVELHCGRRLKSRAYSGATALIANGTGKSWCYCPEFPVTTWTGAQVIEDDGVTLTTLEDTGVRINSVGRVYLPGASFPKGMANIAFTVTAGILTGTRDWEALQAEALRWLQVLYKDQQNVVGRETSISVDCQTVSSQSFRIPPDIIEGLKPFVRRF